LAVGSRHLSQSGSYGWRCDSDAIKDSPRAPDVYLDATKARSSHRSQIKAIRRWLWLGSGVRREASAGIETAPAVALVMAGAQVSFGGGN
jgi:hypothetical protein